MLNDNNYPENERRIIIRASRYREQALNIKTNIQVLRLLWELIPYFKEHDVKCFYRMVQDNCIFRIVLETYKMLYDNINNSENIECMANLCYSEMIQIDRFANIKDELLSIKRAFNTNLKKHNNIKNVIKNLRDEAYAHNDKNNHWFNPETLNIDGYKMTDEIYDSIYQVADICIDYCNQILKMFDQREIVDYSNFDDIKHLFGLKTIHEETKAKFDELL